MKDNNFLSSCREIAGGILDATGGLTGTSSGGEMVGMGADGTPTKRIDAVAEEYAIGYIRDNDLCSTIVSEEAGIVRAGSGNGGTIFLDPIDGTFNAVAGIPFYAVSIAYAIEGELRYGFVQNLASGEYFYAQNGGGAYRNDQPVTVSNNTLLEESAISVYGRKFDPSPVHELGKKIRRWRLLGASAIELCYVACGRLDGFIDIRRTLRVTDAAAGMLICHEAGGKVTDADGLPVVLIEDVTKGGNMVATNGHLHNKVLEYLR